MNSDKITEQQNSASSRIDEQSVSEILEIINGEDIGVPLVVRLEGTNVELGRKMLDESGLELITANDMDDGACKAIAAAGGSK